MSQDEPTGDAHGHGRIVAGEGKGHHKGPGSLLHGPHATEILVISSVAGVLLMWLTFRNISTGGASTSTTTAPAVSTAGVSAGQVAGFDQSAVQSLQQAIAAQSGILAGLVGNGATALPAAGVTGPHAPIASTLFGPSFDGNYVRSSYGSIAEVESDGSLFHLDPSQWAQAISRGGSATQLDTSNLQFYSTSGNVVAASQGTTPQIYYKANPGDSQLTPWTKPPASK